MTIVVTMCKLLLTLTLGFVLCKIDIIDNQTSKRLSLLIVTVTAPLLAISSVSAVKGSRDEVLRFFFIGVLFYLCLPFIGWVVVRLLRISAGLQGTYICMVVFSNTAFMGYPVVSALFGKSAIFYTMIFHMPFNLLFFSLGMAFIRRDAGTISDQNRTVKVSGATLRQVLNNGVIASVIAMILYFSGIELPPVISETCSFIGDTTMPLSMLVIGCGIAGFSFKEIFANRKVYLITITRLIVMPLFAYFVMRVLIDNQLLVKIVTVTVGMPIASLVAMGSAPFPRQGKEAAIGVLFSTLCSMLTIPVLGLLLGL